MVPQLNLKLLLACSARSMVHPLSFHQQNNNHWEWEESIDQHSTFWLLWAQCPSVPYLPYLSMRVHFNTQNSNCKYGSMQIGTQWKTPHCIHPNDIHSFGILPLYKLLSAKVVRLITIAKKTKVNVGYTDCFFMESFGQGMKPLFVVYYWY